MTSDRARRPNQDPEADRAVGSSRRSDEDQAEARAKSLEHGGEGQEGVEGDGDAAKRAAEAILQESEERTFDPDTQRHEGGDVPRRTSGETA